MRVCAFDIETRGFNADYGSVLVVSIKPYGQKPETRHRFSFNDKSDKSLVLWAKKKLEWYNLWVSFNGIRFDTAFLNQRLVKVGSSGLIPRLHCDLYQKLFPVTRMSRHSLGAYARFFGLEVQKMEVPQEVWDSALTRKKDMKFLASRCESDCEITEKLLNKTINLIKMIQR